MLDKFLYDNYINILKEELVPAMGCTEPISLAYSVSKAKEVLDDIPIKGILYVSPNIVKNIKSVVVPHTGGLIGLKAAFLIGLVAGDSRYELETLKNATKEDELKVKEMMISFNLEIEVIDNSEIFEIGVYLESNNHTSYVNIKENHTNIVLIKKDEKIIYQKDYVKKEKDLDYSLLTIENILNFANEVKIEDIKPIIERQIKLNMDISIEGIKNNYGANIGKLYLSSSDSLISKLKAYAASGSDARMNGCELPVVINSGSGNQGLATSVPVIVYARGNSLDELLLYRALIVSNLTTIHLKAGIGTLSAYCGVVSAGAGAAAGISYLKGKNYEEIAHVIINTLAIDSGIICDGAKASCAAKIATAIETGILGIRMQESGNNFYSGCGIVKENVEETIKSVNRLAKKGMLETDKEIIKIMLEKEN